MAGRLGASYIRFVGRNSRGITAVEAVGRDAFAHHPAIIALWHGQFLLVPAFRPRDVPVTAIAARHDDGELLSAALASLDVALVRGAGSAGRKKDRGGVRALLGLKRALDEGQSIVMTADVPPGPARQAGAGIVTLARISGRPIVPVAVATSRYVTFDSWSRMTINLPGGRVAAVAKAPIRVARDASEAEQEAVRLAVEAALNEATAEAYAAVGRDAASVLPSSLTPGPVRPGFGLAAYRGAMGLAGLAAPALLRYRVRQGKEDATRLRERYGYASQPRPEGALAWLHAASVGELNAVLPLLQALRAERPGLRFLVTTGTVTSAAIAARRLGEGDIHQYIPFDTRRAMGRFFDHWRPDLAVLTESEIWPNLILEAHARGVPLALVNGRMSNRSYSRWRRNRGLSRPLFSRFAVVLAQTEKLARRFRELGARGAIGVGNLKIDAPPPPVDAAALAGLRSALAGRPVFVAASTHEGEDDVILAAHRIIAARVPGFLTIIAPRHPERGEAIAHRIAEQGFKAERRSTGGLPGGDCDVYLADTIGELGTFYSLCPLAFIGGSLIQHGGQNPIEAVRCGAGVITGPHHFNFAEAYAALLSREGARSVEGADALAAAVIELIEQPEALAAMRARADAALEGLAGALARTVAALLPVLPATAGRTADPAAGEPGAASIAEPPLAFAARS